MIFRVFLVLAGALALAACNPGAQVEDAKVRIKQFQANYNRGDADALYDSVGETWKKASHPATLKAQLALIGARLGKITASEQTGFNAGFNNGLTTTQVTMKTTFEKGAAQEVFLFHGSGREMELVGWTVNSPLLELTPDDVKKLTESGEAAP